MSPTPMTSKAMTVWRRLGGQRGQAMLEYSSITFFLLLGTAAVGWPFLVALMNALNRYFESIYWVIRAPVG